MTGADEDEVSSGDAVVVLCDDDMVHAFRVLDDGVMERPACGLRARQVGPAEDSDLVCIPCIRAAAELMGCDVAATMAAVEEVVDSKKGAR